MKTHNYTVRGHWPFPTDMLRRDGSMAATSADQELIDRLSTEHAEDKAAFTDVEINLTGPNKPNTERWESFGWTVPTDTFHAAMKADRRREIEDQLILDRALAKLDDDELRVIRARYAVAH